ncbi:peptide methionine sulfoxide reductase MsrA [Planctomycetota bacterium]|nr:peptide methionine sulfoxide reductase MsrA [Planctomycetota bacterium]
MSNLLALTVLAMTSIAAIAADPTPPARQSIVLGGGCFWCVEAAFAAVPGVTEAVSGYAGGTVDNPTYHQVCGADTGHAEVVQITFDPAQVALPKLLDLFFRVHNPTTRDRQGNDVGSQYRSVILVTDAEQRAAATAAIARNQPRFQAPIVTSIVDLATSGAARFHRAEDYHQQYFKKNPNQAYCLATIPPKLEKVRSFLADPNH